MGINIKITPPNNSAMAELMIRAVADRMSDAFVSAGPAIKNRVGIAAVEAIKICPEYISLINGELRGELGVVDASQILNTVCRNIADGILVTSQGVRVVGQRLRGGLTVEILKGDYSEVLSANGSFISEHGYLIDWLRWLTLEGDRIIIADYGYYSNNPAKSRTGLGIMKRPGKWRVPPEFSGTDSDNFITRAIASIAPQVEKIIDYEIKKRLS